MFYIGHHANVRARSVNPLYYVTFTTFTLVASFILFRGFNTTDPINTISLLCGFLTIFTGVYLLNLSREDPDGRNLGIKSTDYRGAYQEVDGIPTDGLAGLQTRFSMQSRRSGETHRRSASWTQRSPADQTHGIAYDLEANALRDLADDDDDDDDTSGSNHKRTSFDDGNGRRVTMNGAAEESSSFGKPRKARTVESERVHAGSKSFDRARR